MKIEPITIAYKHSRLFAVPSIHFRHVFAGVVNQICSHLKTRPDAIAVELGPQSAAAAWNWLRELGAIPNKTRELPVMLGLTKNNRAIRSSYKDKAMRLQQDTGKDLSELPQDLLYHELGFASNDLLCISPTDSIIEAIRCAIELDIPLYGIDLEETASGEYGQTTIEDPIGINGNLGDYIARNAAYADYRRDSEIDARREIAMVARLKTLLKRHRRVVFACGLGHWLAISNMLHDSSTRPSSQVYDTSECTQGIFRRVVLHPLKAIHSMDLFPALVKEYEEWRNPSYDFDKHSEARGQIDLKRIFDNLLKEAFEDYFMNQDQRGSYRHHDLESVSIFERYLMNLCLMNLRVVPDLFMTLSAAQEMMSREFVKALARKFMDFPWASPDEHPGCSLLAPSPDDDGTSACVMFDDDDIPGGKKYFYVRPVSGQITGNTRLEIPYEWEREKAGKEYKEWDDDGILHTWIPWEYLITSMSLRAINQVKRKSYTKTVKVFEGSLLDGIDIKATLRAYSRGKEKIYVRSTVEEPLRYVSQATEGFPVVWLLKPGEDERHEWIALYEYCGWMQKYVRDRNILNHVKKSRGSKMIALTGYGSRHEKTRASEINPKIRSDRYHGIIIYQPICWTKKQFARWVELTEYRRNPFCDHGFLGETAGDLTRLFDEGHGVKIGEHHWTTTMILMALPFAKDIVAVAAPDDYEFDPIVFRKARAYEVDVCRVSLSSFSQQEIERLSINHMSPAIVNDPACVFHESIEAALGEKQTDNEHLVPRSCLDFGMAYSINKEV